MKNLLKKAKGKVLMIILIISLIVLAYFIGTWSSIFAPSEGLTEKEVRQIALEVQNESTTEVTSKQTSKPKKSSTKTKTTPSPTAETEKKSKRIKTLEKCKKMLDSIFYDTGNRYVMNNSDFKFYSDMSCDKEFLISKKLTFVNPLDLEIKNDNGFTVYISRSTDGYVCSVEKPYFDEQPVD